MLLCVHCTYSGKPCTRCHCGHSTLSGMSGYTSSTTALYWLHVHCDVARCSSNCILPFLRSLGTFLVLCLMQCYQFNSSVITDIMHSVWHTLYNTLGVLHPVNTFNIVHSLQYIKCDTPCTVHSVTYALYSTLNVVHPIKYTQCSTLSTILSLKLTVYIRDPRLYSSTSILVLSIQYTEYVLQAVGPVYHQPSRPINKRDNPYLGYISYDWHYSGAHTGHSQLNWLLWLSK